MKLEVVTEQLNFPEGPVVCDDGSVLLVEIALGRVSRVTPDGRIQPVARYRRRPQRPRRRSRWRALLLQ